MGEPLRIDATLEPRGPAGAFVLTDAQRDALAAGLKAFPVAVTVNGTTLQLRAARMGGETLIGMSKAARAEAGVELGATYSIVIEHETTARVVAVPEDLAVALRAHAEVAAAFDALAPSHRKEYVRWVTDAKRDATRAERIAKTVEMVRAGQVR